MAAAMVGGAFLSATLQTLAEKLASTEFRDYIRSRKLNGTLLAEMETTLLTLQAVLDDAEQKQINNPAVKQWLDQLKDAVFDAEDLLNEISYDSLRCKVENKTHAGNITNQVWNFLSSPFKSFYAEINSQMKIMCQRLQLFAQQRDILGLQTVSARVSRRTPSSSVVNESIMVGREDDKEELMSMLLSQRDTGGNNIGVVAILGMGGVGKTTLAQLLYNDTKVQDHFDLKAWACVSEDYDILRVTKTLLESVTSRPWESNNLDFLRVELKKNSREKRFLFVLDDLWNDSYNDWDELVSPFIDGKSGSRVIITTRQQKVAEVTRTSPIHKLEPLSDGDCWSLLSKHAFGGEDFCDRKIARKCGGLPIAAKTLGGLLRSKVDAKQWTEILNSEIWNLPNDNILPALFMSYQYLPSYLKRCFAYCSILPKDYRIDRKQLVLLWMAEGFLEHSQGERAPEEVGDDYFAELLSRSLIQQSNEDVHRDKFVMHDLVNDLATVISGKSCCRLECIGNISKNVRHLSYNQEEYDIFKKFEIFYNFKCLRSFLPISHHRANNYLSRKVVDDFLPTLKRLRVLSLSCYGNITMLPDSFGSLVQLRYLDLSHTGIKSLPDTICNLYNLQTLILSRCRDLTELPIHMEKLISLRHLDIRATSIKEMPLQIVSQENLQTLTVFIVGKQEAGLSVRELGKVSNLRGKLCINNLHNVIDAMEAYDANLKSKEQIEELVLQWGKQTEDSQTEKVVLDMLQPSVNLKELTIDSYGGTTFPSWFGYSSFSNMVFLSIEYCEYCVTLPPLGQLPSLKKLHIEGMRILETIGPEFYGMARGGSNSSFQPFPSLQKLEFRLSLNFQLMFYLLHCSHSVCMVVRLTLFNSCDALTSFPLDGFPALQNLYIYGCRSLESIFISESSSLRPSTLQSLCVVGCKALRSLPPQMDTLTALEDLTLHVLPELEFSFCEGAYLPPKLRCIHITSERITRLPVTEWGLQRLTALSDLWIGDDGIVNTLLKERLLPISLVSLTITNLSEMKSLEGNGILHLSSLEKLVFQKSLEFEYCTRLESLPEDRLPSSLKLLCIRQCPLLEERYKSQEHWSNIAHIPIIKINDEVTI